VQLVPVEKCSSRSVTRSFSFVKKKLLNTGLSRRCCSRKVSQVIAKVSNLQEEAYRLSEYVMRFQNSRHTHPVRLRCFPTCASGQTSGTEETLSRFASSPRSCRSSSNFFSSLSSDRDTLAWPGLERNTVITDHWCRVTTIPTISQHFWTRYVDVFNPIVYERVKLARTARTGINE